MARLVNLMEFLAVSVQFGTGGDQQIATSQVNRLLNFGEP